MDKSKGVQFLDSESVEQTCPEIVRGKEILHINRNQIEGMGYTQADILKLVRVALAEHGKKMGCMPSLAGISTYFL